MHPIASLRETAPKLGIIAILSALAFAAPSTSRAVTLLGGWDFQTTTSGGTAVTASSEPTLFNANAGTEAGTAALYLDGTNGSSAWTGNELAGFAGTALNAGTGMATTTTSPAALAVVGGTAEAANGNSMVFKLSMAGYTNLALTYAAQRTTSGFTSEVWSYSLDAVHWTTFFTDSSVPAAFAAITATPTVSMASLDNQSTVYIEATFTGATSVTGNNRLDNIVFSGTASAVPEPSTYAAIFGLVALAGVIARRKLAGESSCA